MFLEYTKQFYKKFIINLKSCDIYEFKSAGIKNN